MVNYKELPVVISKELQKFLVENFDKMTAEDTADFKKSHPQIYKKIAEYAEEKRIYKSYSKMTPEEKLKVEKRYPHIHKSIAMQQEKKDTQKKIKAGLPVEKIPSLGNSDLKDYLKFLIARDDKVELSRHIDYSNTFIEIGGIGPCLRDLIIERSPSAVFTMGLSDKEIIARDVNFKTFFSTDKKGMSKKLKNHFYKIGVDTIKNSNVLTDAYMRGQLLDYFKKDPELLKQFKILEPAIFESICMATSKVENYQITYHINFAQEMHMRGVESPAHYVSRPVVEEIDNMVNDITFERFLFLQSNYESIIRIENIKDKRVFAIASANLLEQNMNNAGLLKCSVEMLGMIPSTYSPRVISTVEKMKISMQIDAKASGLKFKL